MHLDLDIASAMPVAANVSRPRLIVRPRRVVLVDHHYLFLKALGRFMSSVPELDVVAVTTSSQKALALVALHHPDLLVISITMPDIRGMEVASKFIGSPMAPKIILTALSDDPVYRHSAMAAGAAGYVSKLDLATRLLPMIRSLD